jgi:hypothetical protein
MLEARLESVRYFALSERERKLLESLRAERVALYELGLHGEV